MELLASIKKKHFLVCDDYSSMRDMMKDSLEALGVTKISFATSGTEGIKVIQTQLDAGNPIEFVITDLIMDNGTGIELTKRIRANPSMKHLPILMVTSKSEVSYVMESIKAGINNYIVKPWDLDGLNKKILEIAEKLKLIE